jgi:hypothetical protein
MVGALAQAALAVAALWGLLVAFVGMFVWAVWEAHR